MGSDSDDRADAAAERMKKLRDEVAALAGGADRTFVAADVPPGVEEQFWKDVLAFEHAPLAKPFDLLTRAGITVPAPGDLEDARLPDTLWEVIEGLAALNIFLHYTDHLSDRELYARLWDELLHDDVEMTDDESATQVDLSGNGTDEAVQIYLKYYADDAEREHWAKDWPDVAIPDRAPRPFDRDSRLPRCGW